MLKSQKKFTIALCYDFDGTLSPHNMQEYAFIPALQQKPEKFWGDTGKIAKANDADLILTYMYLMCSRARKAGIAVRAKDFFEFGKSVEFFPGLVAESEEDGDWFSNINSYGKSLGAEVRHYVISSGIKEMIEGTKIGSKFDKIYASSFIYDENGEAVWPAQAINYTTKMQYLFRINKGVLDIQKTINHFMPESDRPVPFKRMIYFGDGTTDIPAMKLVKTQGGYSIAVHNGDPRKARGSEKLLNEDRVNYVAKADYRADSQLDLQVRRVIKKIAAEWNVDEGQSGNTAK